MSAQSLSTDQRGLVKNDRDRLLIAVATRVEAAPILNALGQPIELAGREWQAHAIGRERVGGVAAPANTPAYSSDSGGAGGVDIVVTGIGKANAAACVARLLANSAAYTGVLSVGVAGALPCEGGDGIAEVGWGCDLGDVVLASACVMADEGVLTPTGFIPCDVMGFPPVAGMTRGALNVDPDWLDRWRRLADVVAPIATVSSCSGTDEAARGVVGRTGAVAEAMEGAAVAQTASRLAVRFGELRVVSNTTGHRDRQMWKLSEAVDKLGAVIGRLVADWSSGH